MSESTVFVLIALGVLIIFFLSFFIYKKYISLVNIKRQKEEQAERLRAAQEEKYKHIIDSLKILSQALMTEQVGVWNKLTARKVAKVVADTYMASKTHE